MRQPRLARAHPSVVDAVLITRGATVAISLLGTADVMVGTIHAPLCAGVVVVWPFGCRRPRRVERDRIVAVDAVALTYEQVRGYSRLQRAHEEAS